MIDKIVFIGNTGAGSIPEASPFQFPMMMLILFAIMYFLNDTSAKKKRKKSVKQCSMAFKAVIKF